MLIANDEPFQLNILEYVFAQTGFEVSTAINGLEAFKLIKSGLREEQHFALVVLDLNMPEMGGCETSREINKLYHDFRRNKQQSIIKQNDSIEQKEN